MQRDAMASRLTPLAALALGSICALAPAQPAGSPERLARDESGLAPLDQAVEDSGALSASLRLVPPGLGVPNGFDQVFRLPGDDGKMMRVQGGLYALFDQSVYASGRGGLHVLVPANTSFWIGPPPDLLGAEPAPAFRDRIDDTIVPAYAGSTLRFDGGAKPARSTGLARRAVEPAAAPPRTDEGRIVWDDSYRAERLRRLMARAARAAAPE